MSEVSIKIEKIFLVYFLSYILSLSKQKEQMFYVTFPNLSPMSTHLMTAIPFMVHFKTMATIWNQFLY